MSSEPHDDARFMRRAIVIARKLGANPIGCVIVLDGEIVGEGHNEVDIRHDPTAHAEILAMRRAGGDAEAMDPGMRLPPGGC